MEIDDIDLPNMPEMIREVINKEIQISSMGLNIPTFKKHILVNLCYDMYTRGWKDAHKCIILSLTKAQDLLK